MNKLVAESKGSIDPWIQGRTAPTVTVSPWIQGPMVHFTTICREGGHRPLELNCTMHHRPLNPVADCHSCSSDPLNPGVYGTLGFRYQFNKLYKNRPKSSNSGKIARITPIWTIFWPKTLQRWDLFVEKKNHAIVFKTFSRKLRETVVDSSSSPSSLTN